VYNIHDSTICDSFSKVEEKNICFGSLATDQENADFCKKISDSKQKDSCFCAVAWNKHDKNICKFIEDKESCVIPINVAGPDNGLFCQ